MKFVKNKILVLLRFFTRHLIFLRKKRIPREKINKILINSLYFRGDTLFHTPVFEALRYLFPNAKIDLWVKSRSYDIVKSNKALNNIIVFDNWKTADYNETNKLNLRSKLKFISEIRKERYDLFIDLTGKYSTAILALIGNFKYSGGINYHGFGFLLNQFYDLKTDSTPGHVLDKYLSIIKNIFDLDENKWNELLKYVKPKPYVYTDSTAINLANSVVYKCLIKKGKPLICIHTTAGWSAKELDESKYAELIEFILNDLQYNLVIIGSDADQTKISQIQKLINKNINLSDFFFSLPLDVTVELIKKSDLYIGADSGPLHICGATGTPSIGLFGPTNPEFVKPKGMQHQIVYNRIECSATETDMFCSRNAGKSCKTLDCMKKIMVSEIKVKIVQMLNNAKN